MNIRIAVLAPIATVLSACMTSTTPTYSEQDNERSVIETCQESVKKNLKDPDSAKFGDDWKAWIVTNYSTPPPVSYNPANGDKLYSAGGSVNAKNSFGGYVGNQAYGCDASTPPAAKSAHMPIRSRAS
jgi:hypothetical protein